jgi:capsular polysaccharide biosynthesis protein
MFDFDIRNREDPMEETISLKELLETIRKRLLLIVLITITAVLVSGLVSYFFLTPIYQASTQILVNQTKSDQSVYSPSDVQTNLQLINTYNVIIKSPAILDKVAADLNVGLTSQQLNGEIAVASQTNSQVINLSVQDRDPNRAAQIANKTADVFKSEISNIMKVDNVSILAKATAADHQSPIKPKPSLNMAIALVVGLMAGVGIALLIEYFDNTVKTEQDIERLLELPVLGVIADMSDAKIPAKSTHSRSKKQVRSESLGS